MFPAGTGCAARGLCVRGFAWKRECCLKDRYRPNTTAVRQLFAGEYIWMQNTRMPHSRFSDTEERTLNLSVGQQQVSISDTGLDFLLD
jgi:hypothetical protein